jgi:Trypsin-like peptidase domain
MASEAGLLNTLTARASCRAERVPTRRQRRSPVLVALTLASCADRVREPQLSGIGQQIIYGSDDRLDVYEHPNSVLRQIAASAVVGLVPRAGLSKEGDLAIVDRSLEDSFNVCSDERFVSQPTAAECSGTLIDDDLVLTAGHCISNNEECWNNVFMFDYFLRAESTLEPLSWGDIYGCRRIVKRVVSPDASVVPRIDYAIVQLDRRAIGRTPVDLRTTPLAIGEPLATISCASGLPLKIDSGARVLATRNDVSDYFLLDSDTFQSSSGAGVFDANGALAGVLVRGGEDYIHRADAMCQVPNIVNLPPDAAIPRSLGEEATYVERALDGLCSEVRWPSHRLCDLAPSCGDGICNAQETQLNCETDCACKDCPSSQPRASAGALVVARDADGCALGSDRGSVWLALLGLLRRRRPSAA